MFCTFTCINLTFQTSQAEKESGTLLSIPDQDQLHRLLGYLFQESEFLSQYGIRSLSKVHVVYQCAIYITLNLLKNCLCINSGMDESERMSSRVPPFQWKFFLCVISVTFDRNQSIKAFQSNYNKDIYDTILEHADCKYKHICMFIKTLYIYFWFSVPWQTPLWSEDQWGSPLCFLFSRRVQ